MKNFILICIAAVCFSACSKHEVMTPDLPPPGTETKALGVTSVFHNVIFEATCPGNGVCYWMPDPQNYAHNSNMELVLFLEDDNNVPSHYAAEAYMRCDFFFNPDGSPVTDVVTLTYTPDTSSPNSLHPKGKPFTIHLHPDGNFDLAQ